MFKKFIIRLSIFFALLLLLDIIIGFSIRKIYFKQNHGSYYRTTFVFEEATPQIIILGSSKASHDYISPLIEDSLKLSCYNGGRDGSVILYSNAALNSLLKRYTPRIVILDILEDELEKNSYKIEDKLSVLLPYYKTHPEIRSIVDMKGPLEKYKLLSGMYTFNTLILPSITGALDLNNKSGIEKDKGYLPLFEKWNGKIEMVDSRQRELDDSKVQMVKNIISSCKQKNIRLVIVISPTYKSYYQNYNPTVNLVSKMANSGGIPFWNYLTDTIYKNKIYFKDVRHLNNDGAKIFTADIIRRLKEVN